jgi:hypothetical protein
MNELKLKCLTHFIKNPVEFFFFFIFYVIFHLCFANRTMYGQFNLLAYLKYISTHPIKVIMSYNMGILFLIFIFLGKKYNSTFVCVFLK